MNRALIPLVAAALYGAAVVAMAADTAPFISGTGGLTSGHVVTSGATVGQLTDGGVAVSSASVNSWTASNTFAEVHPTVETVTLTSNNYTAVAADCGKMKILPTGTTPTVTLPANMNQGCAITFVTSVIKSYHFISTGSGSVINSQGFFNSRGTSAGDTISVGVVTPSSTAAVWVAVGDLTS